MYQIRASSLISIQDSFKNKNWSENIINLENLVEYSKVEYNEFLPPPSLRRLSPVIKSALSNAIYCKNETGEDFDAIIVGTSLGCLQDTEKFLQNINVSMKNRVSVSPTAFIQSTHNTIGGQISLFLKNHSYNMTHTQNSLSMEISLIDAMLCVNEGKNNVLVGTADEYIPFLDELNDVILRKNYPFTFSSGFICIGNCETNNYNSKVKDVKTFYNEENIEEIVLNFLRLNKLKSNDIDLFLFSGINDNTFLFNRFKNKLCYTEFSGFHYSNAIFALLFAVDKMQFDVKIKNTLIFNNLCKGSLGLTLLSNEA